MVKLLINLRVLYTYPQCINNQVTPFLVFQSLETSRQINSVYIQNIRKFYLPGLIMQYMPQFQLLQRLTQEDYKFEANLGNLERQPQNKNTTKCQKYNSLGRALAWHNLIPITTKGMGRQGDTRQTIQTETQTARQCACACMLHKQVKRSVKNVRCLTLPLSILAPEIESRAGLVPASARDSPSSTSPQCYGYRPALSHAQSVTYTTTTLKKEKKKSPRI